jgi:hypothetical protein
MADSLSFELKNIELNRMFYSANPGASFALATREAMMQAILFWANITIVFNDKNYNICVKDLVACIKEEE